MRIGGWPWSRTAVTPINTLGFPDEEFPTPDAESACLRIMVVGDSFVLGDGVDGDSNFVAVFERAVAARPGARCIRVFNLGERGTTIPRQARRVREFRALLRPHLVLLGQYQNDLTDLPNREPRDRSIAALATDSSTVTASRPLGEATAVPREYEESTTIQQRFQLLNPALVRMLTYHAVAALITSGIHRDELRHWSVIADTTRRDEAARLTAQYAAAYDSLATELARDSIGFGVIILPSKFDLLAGRFPEEDFFLGLAERHGVPALRIFPILDAHRRPYPFLMYDGHLNPRGNRLVADALMEWLFAREPAPFPVLREAAPE